MLYTIFLYQSESGVMMYKKSFEEQIGEKSEMFASFFSAIQNFVKQMITTDAKGKGLELIDLGTYLVNITKLPDLKVDCVLIADRTDTKEIKKFVPKLSKLLQSHVELFEEWDGNLSRFDVLDMEILQVLDKYKRLSGKDSEVHDKTRLIDEILGRLPELKKEQVQHYMQEKQFLEKKLKNSISYFRKLEIIDSIEEVCRKLRDKQEMEKTLKLKSKINRDLTDLKQKLEFYLTKAKNSIATAIETHTHKKLYDIDFRDAYINLYSFSTKLKFVGREDLSQKYRSWAMQLIDKPPELEDKFSQLLNTVLRLPSDINQFMQEK